MSETRHQAPECPVSAVGEEGDGEPEAIWPMSAESNRAAQRMHRRVGDPAGWPLSYERPVSGLVWVWREGKNCHPNPID